jgi:hypothetical protein
VGLIPTTELKLDGHIIEPSVSVPMVTATKFAAAARTMLCLSGWLRQWPASPPGIDPLRGSFSGVAPGFILIR